MTTIAPAAAPVRRVGPVRSTLRDAGPAMCQDVTAVINQPLPTVAAHVCSMMATMDGHPTEWYATLLASHTCWGQSFRVVYALYEVPGGTQVTASIHSEARRFRHPVPGLASQVLRQRVARELADLRGCLE